MALTIPATMLAFVFAAVPAQGFSGEFLEWAILFFILAIVAAVLGAGNVAGVSMEIAKWLIIIFVVLAVITLLL